MTPVRPSSAGAAGPPSLLEGEIVHVPLRQAAAAGAFGGLVVGGFIGSLIGALVAWLAGAVIDWQRDLAFTLGVARRLLPFGDQVAFLRWIDATWFVVIPTVALALALVAALFGGTLGLLVGAAYNRSRRHVRIRILPDHLAAPTPVPAAPD